MTRRYTHLMVVAITITACSASISVQEETVAEMRAKVEQGDTEPQFSLGFTYANGEAVPTDDAEAARWYRLAEQGNAYAQRYLWGHVRRGLRPRHIRAEGPMVGPHDR